MADLSKLRFNGTDYNVKDASAPLRKFTNYSKTGNLPITSDDTTQTAIGKLEKALDDKINTSAKGTSNGVAELDANGKVPSSQLPSYVDDVLEYSAKSSFPATGETGKIYVDTTTNKTYRWSGSAYVEISESLALGETSSTAYRGDRGKAAYDHSQITNGNPHGTTGANTNLTGYSKGSSKDAVAATDTVNAAIAKHENRIDTNQSNISSVSNGVKLLTKYGGGINKLRYNNSTETVGEATFTINDDKSISIYTNGATTTARALVLVLATDNINVDATDIVSGLNSYSGNGIYFGWGVGSSGGDRVLYPNEVQEAIGTSGVMRYFAVYVGSGVNIPQQNAFTVNPMIVSAQDYANLSGYQPYALPNSDLTVREAEDRAALVEQVDDGAKNLFDDNNITELERLSQSGNVYAATVNDTANKFNLMGYQATPSAVVARSIYTPDIDTNGVVFGVFTKDPSATLLIIGHSGATINNDIRFDISSLVNGEQYVLAINITQYNPQNTLQFKNVMICTKSKFDISPTYEPHALPNYDLTQMVSDLQKKAVKVYTYHVNPNESDPEDAVTYLDDAAGLTPAKMGASSFSYGSWANAWFLPRPCVLKFDGTVDYYLNPNDYSKKTDGTASTIDSSNSTGNVMLEFPKIWVKRVNDGNGARTVSIAPVNVDGTYKCWSNINAEDKEVDHFYLPAYNGTIHSSKMRSLSGVTLNSTYAPNYTRAQEVTAATANNPTGKNMWYTETWADMCLVYDLLYLMGKSLDVQRTFGQGLSSGAETAMRAYVTGTHNAKGLFYGDVSGTSTAVKVLGMENLWGCRWHGVAGLINDNGVLKVKMTYGVADGSTDVGYNTTGSGYLNYGSTYGTAGSVKKMQADNTMGYKIIETAGTDATYYCDYYYVNNSQSNYALLGGYSVDGAGCGFYVHLGSGAATANWAVGGSLSCRPES